MDIMAERELEFVELTTGRASSVRLVVGKPERDGDDWIAPVAIDGPFGEHWENGGHGVDSLQALHLGLHLLSTMAAHRFRGRGTLTSQGGPWDGGLVTMVIPPAPDAGSLVP
jgi:hypothetical protein